MRYLGLDLGTVTLGVAVSDKTNTIATPVKTLRFSENKVESVLEELKEIVVEKNITAFVLGLPKNLDNTSGYAVERSLKFKEILEDYFSLPVYLVDERYSTIEAEKILISTDTKRKKRKKVIDNIAATLILETYLKKERG